jgi:hypothetical protein
LLNPTAASRTRSRLFERPLRMGVEVTLRLSDPGEKDALHAFLEKRECHVQELADDMLRVGMPHELHEQQARLEVDLYLRVWESLHDSRIEIVS